MRSITLSAILALASLCANAAPIPSDASGGYLTTDRACRLILSRPLPSHTDLDIQCLRWGDGLVTRGLFRMFTPSGQCPDGYVFPFDPRTPAGKVAASLVGLWHWTGDAWAPVGWGKSTGEVFSLRSYNASTGALAVIVGTDPSTVINGIGVPQTWHRVEWIVSPQPYSCAGKHPSSGGALGR